MLRVSFDSNIWMKVCNPSRFMEDPMYSSFMKIYTGLQEGQIEGHLSETIFTLEAIPKKDRKNFLTHYVAKSRTIVEESSEGARIKLCISPNSTVHPGNNSYLKSEWEDASSLGFKIMRCYRIRSPKNLDIKEEYYVKTSTPSNYIADRFGEVGRKVESMGAGIAWVKKLGYKYAKCNEAWNEASEKKVAEAFAEWADGDMVSAHVAYQNDYICTLDNAKGAGQKSIFSQKNRTWLERGYDVKFISPEHLANLVSSKEEKINSIKKK